MELLTVFWQSPRKEQVCEELGNGIILIRDEATREPIGFELLGYKPGDKRFDSVSVEIGREAPVP
jgi:hypothetical protein